ncbi:hypothetical protein LTR16_008463, partial [Cryomyces antarcticus]
NIPDRIFNHGGGRQANCDAPYRLISYGYTTWCVDLRSNDLCGRSEGPSKGASPSVTEITDLFEALFLNDMTILPNTSYVLTADSGASVVRRVDTGTGGHEVVLSDTAKMAPPENAVPAIGISGLHVQGSYLYYTNTRKALSSRVRINSVDGTAAGPYEVMASGFAGDDFTFSNDGVAWAGTNTGNTLVKVAADGT